MPRARDEQRVVLQMAGEVWGLDASLVSQKKAMEAENRRLKQIYADPKAKLRALKLKFHIQQRGKRGKPTTERANDMGVPCCAPSASCGPRP